MFSGKYPSTPLRVTPSTPPPEPPFRRAGLRVKRILIAAGFISLISQLVIFREFLNVFDGNELLIGLLLFTWMIFTSIGSFAGIRLSMSRYAEKYTGFLFLLSGIFPLAVVLALYYLKFSWLPPGISGGLSTVLYFSSIVLIPVCMVNGMLFSLLSCLNSVVAGSNQTAKSYGYDTLGSVIAGLLFTIVLSYLLSTMQILFMLITLTSTLYLLFFSTDLLKKITLIVLGSGALAAASSGYPDSRLRSVQYQGQEIRYSGDTPYGNVCITATTGQINIFQNGILFYSTNNDQGYEESVHFALLQRTTPKKVLVVSGGVNGAIKQVFKYNSVSRLDYAEVNPWLIKAETEYIPLSDTSRVTILNTDARRHIKNCSDQYDAIIMNLPEPLNAQINRYYTVEFFKEAKKALKPGGIFETSLGVTSNYVSGEEISLNASLFKTLKQVFERVGLVVSGKNYYIASDRNVSLKFDSLLFSRTITNDFVNAYYFDDELTAQRSAMVLGSLDTTGTGLNRDIHPVTYVLQIREWLTRFEDSRRTIILATVFLVLLISLILFKVKNSANSSLTVISSAFAGASALFLLIMIFQVLFGQIYRMIGLLFAVYMAGLSAGSFAGTKSASDRRNVLYYQIILFALVLMLPLLIRLEPVSDMSRLLVKSVILLYAMLIAFGAGVLYSYSTSLPSTPPPEPPFRRAGLRVNLYGIDLIASALGMLVTSLLLYPVGGIWITTICSSVLLAASFVVNLRNHY